ncbi:MAG: hypothetical protein DHS20C16_32860 [Phycisphaerae bacterium]|nr:MAG: hypothetical protein DHS20C16_32860 [Phycisphaerae bacterium]
MSDNILLIGVDGGATEVKAHEVLMRASGDERQFELGNASASRVYESVPGFVPVPVTQQFSERDHNAIEIKPAEQQQADKWIDATFEAVAEVASKASSTGPVQIGIGMPGLKSPDKRGIVVINNGPRLPKYLEQLEGKLEAAGIKLATPIAALGSDADYCGIGEEYASNGLFRDVENAYYMGAGTGVADAMKLNGKLVTFDEASTWIQKSWQVASSFGPTFEKLISARSMNETYHRLIGHPSDAGAKYPEVDAINGNPIAVSWMDSVAMLAAELIFERLQTVTAGRPDRADRGDAYTALNSEHPFRGTALDRVIIGQRLGQICSQPHQRSDLLKRITECLAAFVRESKNDELIQAYTPTGTVKPGLLVASNLRAAPAIGAAVAANTLVALP